MFDPQNQCLTQLSPIDDTSCLDMKFMGSHKALLGTLFEFCRGELYCWSGKRRRSYRDERVLDMSLIRMHFARGEICERSFKCHDFTFFIDENQKNNKQLSRYEHVNDEVKDQPTKAKRIGFGGQLVIQDVMVMNKKKDQPEVVDEFGLVDCGDLEDAISDGEKNVTQIIKRNNSKKKLTVSQKARKSNKSTYDLLMEEVKSLLPKEKETIALEPKRSKSKPNT